MALLDDYKAIQKLIKVAEQKGVSESMISMLNQSLNRLYEAATKKDASK